MSIVGKTVCKHGNEPFYCHWPECGGYRGSPSQAKKDAIKKAFDSLMALTPDEFEKKMDEVSEDDLTKLIKYGLEQK